MYEISKCINFFELGWRRGHDVKFSNRHLHIWTLLPIVIEQYIFRLSPYIGHKKYQIPKIILYTAKMIKEKYWLSPVTSFCDLPLIISLTLQNICQLTYHQRHISRCNSGSLGSKCTIFFSDSTLRKILLKKSLKDIEELSLKILSFVVVQS